MQSQTASHRVRLISSIAATMIALACGTNYVYSAWSPQFAERLKLSSTESNALGIAGNLGQYTLGAPIGYVVDRWPRPAVLAGSVILAVGYFPLHEAYDSASGSVPLLCFFSYLSGLGSCMAFAAAVKTSALNWPHHRGTATAFPLAAFGLSAFFFSFLGSLLFSGDPGSFLMLLAAGTSSMTFVGFFFLKVYPHSHADSTAQYSSLAVAQEEEEEEEEDEDEEATPASGPLRRTASAETKPRNSDLDKEPGTSHDNSLAGPSRSGEAAEDCSLDETSSLIAPATGSSYHVPPGSLDLDSSRHLDIRGIALLRTLDFWQLFLVMAVLAGVGLMTINNIGNDAKALWEKYDDSVSEDFLVLRQQMHVSVLSICSFLGRLSSGVGSDWLVKNLHASRVWCLVVATIIFFFAQLCALNIENPHFLIFVSSLSGLGYGFLFGVFPSIVAETFGVRGLSQNWGCLTLAPVVSSNIFNLGYGRIYDQHSTTKPGGHLVCLEGLECYRDAYLVTLAACGLGLVASFWIIWRKHVQQTKDNSKGDLEQ